LLQIGVGFKGDPFVVLLEKAHRMAGVIVHIRYRVTWSSFL
jgi:hypothetical protein